MSKSASDTVKILVPALVGAGVLLGGSLMLANSMADEAPEVAPYVPALAARAAPAPEPAMTITAMEEPETAAEEVVVEVEIAEAAPVEVAGVPAEIAAQEASAPAAIGPSEDDIILAQAAGAQAAPAVAGALGLGRPALPEEVAAWDIDIRPDGAGLPEGSGDVWTGGEIYDAQCAACHGDFGEGAGRWPVLMGGFGSLDGHDPVKTPGSYWPYLSTIWDYVHRAMPFGAAQTLTDDEVYALTAYILYLNDLVDDDFELSKASFAEMALPNEGNFFPDDRAETELAAFSAEPCMSDCGAVEITRRAAVIDVTPEETAAREALEAAAGEAEEQGSNLVESAAEIGTMAAGDAAEADAEVVASAMADPIDMELAAAGEAAFRRCKSCHQVGEGAKNRSGPALAAVVGGPIGAVEGFRYSAAFQELHDAGEVWTEASLSAFIENPKAWAPGTKMSFSGLRAEEDRMAIVEYLRSVAE